MIRTAGVLLCLFGSWLVAPGQQKSEPELTPAERQKLQTEAFRLTMEATKLYQEAKYQEAEASWRKILELNTQLYPPSKHPQGHFAVARCLGNLGNVLWMQGKLSEAERVYRDALTMHQKLYPAQQYPDGHEDIAWMMDSLAVVLQDQGKLIQAENLCRDALAMRRKLFSPTKHPNGHTELAQGLNNLALVLQEQDKLPEAEALYQEALAMDRKLYPKERYPHGHAHLAKALMNLGLLLDQQGKLGQAEPLLRDAIAMMRQLYPPAQAPRGHPDLAVCLNNLGYLLKAQGKLTAAEPFCRDALAMYRQLYPPQEYPNGHTELAQSIKNLALWHVDMQQYAQAEILLRETVEMLTKLCPATLYPDGHPEVAQALNSLASVLQMQGKLDQAEPLIRRALTMRQKLYTPRRYPQGHPQLALSIHNLAALLNAQGQYAAAETQYRAALEMFRQLYPPQLYPDGHPEIAAALNNLGFALLDREQGRQAEPLLREALLMNQRLAVNYAALRGEGEALTLLGSLPGMLHGYLSLAKKRPALATRVYDTLWNTRSALTRLAERRHGAVRRAGLSPQLRQRWQTLTELRQQRARLLLQPQPRDAETAQARNRRLADWDRQITDLAAALQADLPDLQERQRTTPHDLQEALPADTVFVDCTRYIFCEADPIKLKREGKKCTDHYIAFLVTKDRVHCIDLGPAAPIENALHLWRETLSRRVDTPVEIPHTLRRLLWEPLEKHFPAGTNTVYLSPDQSLCFLPWAALPGKKPDTVLLEEYTLALVPHGPYLLRELTAAQGLSTKATDVLLLGQVPYDEPVAQSPPSTPSVTAPNPIVAQAAKWPMLPGAARETTALAKLVTERKLRLRTLTGVEAGVPQVREHLPQARYAHLATHGFFADPKFRSLFQMDEQLFAMRGNERVGSGMQNPGVLSGLVFAGANRPETPGRGILTAEELVDLDLTGMELAVLSACETGLGDVAGGEGVFGLQRAFHIAGCKNVIASLWKVDDAATMILMEEFYRNLWEKKLTKREALRQAQLTLWRNPQRVASLTAQGKGERGPDLSNPKPRTPVPAERPGTSGPARASVKQWAAFVLSGLGE
jgi:CHAT domain-containing protein/tetratricopeptide (TPR) repeat protein